MSVGGRDSQWEEGVDGVMIWGESELARRQGVLVR